LGSSLALSQYTNCSLFSYASASLAIGSTYAFSMYYLDNEGYMATSIASKNVIYSSVSSATIYLATNIQPNYSSVSVSSIPNLNYPNAISDGLVVVNSNIYFSYSYSDFYGIKRVDNLGNVYVFAGSGTQGCSDGGAASATFNDPKGLAVLGNFLYVADAGCHTIRQLNLTNGNVITVAGTYSSSYVPTQGGTHAPNYCVDDPNSINATFFKPTAIAAYPNSNSLYVIDSGNRTIRKLVPTGGGLFSVSTYPPNTCYNVGPSLSPSVGASDGLFSTAGSIYGFAIPYGIALQDPYNIYVTDVEKNTVRLLSSTDGGVSFYTYTVAGTANSMGDVTGQMIVTSGGPLLYQPKGITLSPQTGYLYVADYSNRKVKQLFISTPPNKLSTALFSGQPNPVVVFPFAGSGSAASNEGTLSTSAFDGPSGIAQDSSGQVLYIIDSLSGKIRMISGPGIVF
ncbi:MAG: hypothetical protein K2X39_04685, partial [Silvanigrellaceae bacterium]|nr:hypothetical protein [Silvanigrellaceae bacterium]